MASLTIKQPKGPFQQLHGTFTIASYIIVWIASLLSPFLIAIALYTRRYVSGTFLTLVVLLCYMPIWQRFPSLKIFLGRGSLSYFTDSSILYENGVPASRDHSEGPSLLCVHPHGIFCMGWGILFGRPELDSLRFCFSSVLYASPFFRVFCKLIGNPAPADKRTFQVSSLGIYFCFNLFKDASQCPYTLHHICYTVLYSSPHEKH